jgi:hypothetical protein
VEFLFVALVRALGFNAGHGKNRNSSYGVKEVHPIKNKNKIFPP